MKKFILMIVVAGASFFILDSVYADSCNCPKDKICVYSVCNCTIVCKTAGTECAGIADCGVKGKN